MDHAADGRMSQTGPKKCFILQNCEKYTNFDWTEDSFNVYTWHPQSYISLESLYSMDVIYANIKVKIQDV